MMKLVRIVLTLLALSCSTLATSPLLVPVLPLSIAINGTWPPPWSPVCKSNHCGDIRALIELTAGDITASNAATVQIFWRRRDPHPAAKGIIVTDEAGVGGFDVSASTLEGDCGVITFSRPNLSPGAYYVYYLPYQQNGGGAGLQFNWGNCSSQDPTEANQCVGGRRLGHGHGLDAASPSESSACLSATAASKSVVGLENRDAFNAFTEMEIMATAGEMAAARAAVGALTSPPPFVAVFTESASAARSVRVFDAGIPARWVAAAGTQGASAFAATAAPGQWLAFQVGLWAYKGAVYNVSAVASTLTAPSGAVIDAAALTVMNLEGTDVDGLAFKNMHYSLETGSVGSLWCSLAVPIDAAAGVYAGTLSLTAAAASASYVSPPIFIALLITVGGPIVPSGGADDIESMARLAWLNSQRGLEDTVPLPFVPVSAVSDDQGTLTVTALRKSVVLSLTGLPATVHIDFQRLRLGVPTITTHSLLASPVTFDLYQEGDSPLLNVNVTVPTFVTRISNSNVAWAATWTVAVKGGGVVIVNVEGDLDFTSILTYAITLSSPAPGPAVSLSDIRLHVPVSHDLALGGYIAGMADCGDQAQHYIDRAWRWSNGTGMNKVYVGHPEAAVIVNLKGDGAAWDSPMFGNDYPVIPFVPTSWGGVAALPSGNVNGVNITNGTVSAFSGPRMISSASTPAIFRFALQLLPSKATNWARHWATRTQQLGYDVPYSSPADVAALGVTVVTLHQGTPGIVNGSLINPWINYPFLNDTVPFLTNFTAQANALGLAVKYYYTIRELSSRAPEMFAFKAMQGEIVVDFDPYMIVQPGYSHQWNTHGGAAWLHQHMVSHYGGCWQQRESNGEIDPSACTHGVSRLFNYYIEGLAWSFSQAPYINGIYYDGINFARGSMIRVRRAADAAAAAANRGFPAALLDLHTGRDGTPPTCSYAAHYPLVDYLWNGEGFNFRAPPAYYVIEISGAAHGLSGDMLGAGADNLWRGLLFGMTDRDAVTSTAIWRMWDAVRIQKATALFAFWELDGHAVNASAASLSATNDAVSSSPCTFNVTNGSYPSGANEQCLQPDGPFPGCWASSYDLPTVQAACCANAGCAGFSYETATGVGCCKASQDGTPSAQAGYDGYWKSGWIPPPEPTDCALASVYSAYGSHAIVFLASWCIKATNVTLSVDWVALGIEQVTAIVTLPNIDGVQTAARLADAVGPFLITPTGGFAMLITKA